MATKVKPCRIKATGTPQVGYVPKYVDEDTFQWGAGGGGGGSDIVYATQAEYNALLPGAASDGKHYFIYTPSVVPPTPRTPGVNTLAYYQFEQDLNDSSGNGYNITTSSDYSFVEVGGQYVVQDGGSIRLGLPYAPFNTIGTGDFAISFWLYPITPSNTSNREPVILGSARSYSPYVGPGIFYDYYGYGDEGMTNPDRKIYWRTARGVYGLGGLTADYINGWHHFVMTRISGTVYCYVDKVQVCQYSSSSNISGITGLGSFVGASSNREPQGWGTSGAKGDSLILENIGWTSQNVSDYFDTTKATYGIS